LRRRIEQAHERMREIQQNGEASTLVSIPPVADPAIG
jgi:hypothetical protein